MTGVDSVAAVNLLNMPSSNGVERKVCNATCLIMEGNRGVQFLSRQGGRYVSVDEAEM